MEILAVPLLIMEAPVVPHRIERQSRPAGRTTATKEAPDVPLILKPLIKR